MSEENGRRVVVGVDGSAAGQAALLWAGAEARTRGCLLEIVHVWEDRPRVVAPYAPMPGARDPQDVETRGKLIVERAVAAVRRRHPGLRVDGVVLRGNPESELPRRSSGAALLVLGSAAHLSGDGRLGAVLLSCLRWPSCPVVVVHPSPVPAQPEPALLQDARAGGGGGRPLAPDLGRSS